MTNNASVMNRWTLSGVDIHKNILMKSLIYHCLSLKNLFQKHGILHQFHLISQNLSRTTFVSYSMKDHDIFLFCQFL